MQATDRLEETQDPAPPEGEAAPPAKARRERKARAPHAASGAAGKQPRGEAPEGKHPKAERAQAKEAEAKQPKPKQPKAAAKAEAGEGKQPKGERLEAKGQPQAERPAKGRPALKAAPMPMPPGYVPRLKERYKKEVAPALIKEFGYKNVMQVPQVTKVVVNVGLGEALTNPKAPEACQEDLAAITGQHAVLTKAKKSVANFKLRQGMVIGAMATLRGTLMYEFLDRLINVALPRIRDFRGAPVNGFDGRGNYSMGFREQVMFPEIDFNAVDRIRGLQVTIVTTARTDDEARRLLALMGMAFARDRAGAAA